MSKFQPLFPNEVVSKKRLSKKQKKELLEKQKEEERERLGKENLSKLDPMVVPLLIFHASQNKNTWIVDSAKAALDSPYKLSEKWINSLNKWSQKISKAMSLEEPKLEPSNRYFFEKMKIVKITPPKEDQAYPQYALTVKDEKGWSYYFKTSKATEFSVGSFISFKATVRSHSEGISFLSRASSIKEVQTLPDETLNGEIKND
jgi:hypothetical protein